MHLPDGYLSLPVAAGCAATAVVAVRGALRSESVANDERAAPLIGASAAGLFAAQMVNFPLPGGFSGHLLGGVLVARLIGPKAGLLVVVCVLVAQCLFFADGGLLALGANITNMGVATCLAGWPIWRVLHQIRGGTGADAFAAGVAAWASTVLAAGLCSMELALSGVSPFFETLRVLAPVHMVVGVLEGMVTALVVATMARRRPALVALSGMAEPVSLPVYLTAGGAVTLVLLFAGAPFSSNLPDGLEFAVAQLGLAGLTVGAIIPAPFPDYAPADAPFWRGAAVIGLIGVGLTASLAYSATRLARAARRLQPVDRSLAPDK